MTTTVDPNYWSLLGVSPDCDSNELKSAFRKEARKWHPDLNKNDVNAEERFKLINEAYAILSDPKKRKEWEKLNNKLQLDCSDKVTILRNDDLIAIIKHMLDLKDGKGEVDDIDPVSYTHLTLPTKA